MCKFFHTGRGIHTVASRDVRTHGITPPAKKAPFCYGLASGGDASAADTSVSYQSVPGFSFNTPQPQVLRYMSIISIHAEVLFNTLAATIQRFQ